jgi:hypothetical protein
MKIEYLPAGSPDCPLIRLYDFDPSEAVQLQAACASLADGTCAELQLNDLPFIDSAQCTLALRVGERDRGVSRVHDQSFECVLTSEGWWEVMEKIEPFIESCDGHQWLNCDDAISLLLTPTGKW